MKKYLFIVWVLLVACQKKTNPSPKEANPKDTSVVQPSFTSLKNYDTTKQVMKLEDFEMYNEAHPKARKLMTEDFYWSPIEETGPFGNDDGADAFYRFKDWRKLNPQKSPVHFFHELIEIWGYPPFDYASQDVKYLENYMSASSIGDMTLIGQDNAIISIGFGQFIMEGRIDSDIMKMTQIAIKREMMPVMLSKFGDDYIGTRKDQLNKMLKVVEQMNQ
jgi:uncharacterized protein YfeS